MPAPVRESFQRFIRQVAGSRADQLLAESTSSANGGVERTGGPDVAVQQPDAVDATASTMNGSFLMSKVGVCLLLVLILGAETEKPLINSQISDIFTL